MRSVKVFLTLVTLLLVSNPIVAQTNAGRPKDLATIVKEAGPSVALIVVNDQDGNLYTGTGFVIRQDGLIVTAQHIIDRWQRVRVRFSDGTVRDASQVWAFKRTDIALLKVTPPVPPALNIYPKMIGKPFANGWVMYDPPKIYQGDEILVLGYPLVDALGYREITVTRGIISAIRGEEIQLDAAVNPGNSGGPVLNIKGQVLGYITSKLREASLVGFATMASSINWALIQYNKQRIPFDVFIRNDPTEAYDHSDVVGWREAQPGLIISVREFATVLGADVSFDSSENAITVRKGDFSVRLQVGSDLALANGTRVNIGHTIEPRSASVPVQFLVNALGGGVSVDNQHQVIYVTKTR